MPRKFRRSYRRRRPSTHHTRSFSVSVPQDTQVTTLLVENPQTTGVFNAGLRVSGMQLSIASNQTFVWAVIYVPDGYDANGLTTSASSSTGSAEFYEPQQFLLGSGMWDPDKPSSSLRARSCFLREGDRIVLKTATVTAAAAAFQGLLKYTLSQ